MWIENRKRYRIRKVICAILGICTALILMGAVCDRQEVIVARHIADAQEKMSDEVFRFHVLANSDSEDDQELKLKVRDGILSHMKELMEIPPADARETKLLVMRHLDEIKQMALEVIREEGYRYPVNVMVAECYFPDRRYGDVLFQKGYYDALRVEIGEADGHNWWCVLYPSLCFVDATCAVVTDEGEQELKEVLGRDTYEEVTVTSSNFKIKSFFYEYFKERTDSQMEEGQ